MNSKALSWGLGLAEHVGYCVTGLEFTGVREPDVVLKRVVGEK
jgi:hypothetical protein